MARRDASGHLGAGRSLHAVVRSRGRDAADRRPHRRRDRRRSMSWPQRPAADADSLQRVLRHLVGQGRVRRAAAGRFALERAGPRPARTRAVRLGSGSRRLRRAHGVRLGQPARRRGTGGPAYHAVFGRPFWEDLEAHPEIAASFDALMGPAGARRSRPGGAGQGRLGIGAHRGRRRRRDGSAAGGDPPRPARRCGARWSICRRRWRDRARSSRPPAWPTGSPQWGRASSTRCRPAPISISLKNVLGDWPDREAMAILRRCAEAARPAGRVVVLGGVSPDEERGPSPGLADDGPGGREERSLAEFRALARAAGLEVQAAERQPSGRFVVECHPCR